MSSWLAFERSVSAHPVRTRLLRAAMALFAVATIAGCGGSAEVVVVDPGPPPIVPLSIALTRVGPEALQIDWSDDPYAASFTVVRDGAYLASVTTATTIVDASVLVNDRYCYQVSGYNGAGRLISASDTACITLLP